jgi:hypothetical protein
MNVIIDREKWYRGKSKDSFLVRSDGNMCCMGMVASQLGMSAQAMLNYAWLYFDMEVPKILQPLVMTNSNPLIQNLVSINDVPNGHTCYALQHYGISDLKITDTSRELALTRAFAGIGITVEFAN